MSKITMMCVSLAAVACANAQEIDVAKVTQAKEFKTPYGESLKYRIYVPPEMKAGVKYPLVLLLHGAGERGNDNVKQMVHGVTPLILFSQKNNLPFILVAPQCPDAMQWVNAPWGADAHVMPEFPSLPLKLALELCQDIASTMPVDTSRIYVTGLSMGGYGAWDAIQRKPGFFAAAMPICGGGDAACAERIKDVPIWAFHGGSDTVVKPERSRKMIEAIKQAGGTPKYTEYPGEGHGSWGKAYADQEALNWLFAQKKH